MDSQDAKLSFVQVLVLKNSANDPRLHAFGEML